MVHQSWMDIQVCFIKSCVKTIPYGYELWPLRQNVYMYYTKYFKVYILCTLDTQRFNIHIGHFKFTSFWFANGRQYFSTYII